ncbi:MAG TPA: helix-turn-helix transcriptional regulator [Rhizomicrobium sp.]|nr:helix-turn-helix transcriptional regulator [Rhizomicrobium sp.]
MTKHKKPNRIDIHVGRALLRLRLTRGVSTAEMAARLGIGIAQLRKHERGSARIYPAQLFEIAKMLDVSVSAFFDGLL